MPPCTRFSIRSLILFFKTASLQEMPSMSVLYFLLCFCGAQIKPAIYLSRVGGYYFAPVFLRERDCKVALARRGLPYDNDDFLQSRLHEGKWYTSTRLHNNT